MAGPRPRRTSRGAFTLLEVLLALALLSLLAGILVTGSARLLTEQPISPQDVFWKAVQEARKTALKLEHEVRLKFDKERKQFVIVDGIAPAALAPDGFTKQETPLKTLPVPLAADSDLSVDFLPASGKGRNTILIGGVLIESQPVAYVTFYSDGSCTAFRAQFMRNGAASTLNIDPWTCAEVLTPKENTL